MPSVSVEQAEPFLWLEDERHQSDLAENIGSGDGGAVYDQLTFPDDGQGQVGELGEVAGSSNRAIFGDRRHEPASQQLHDEHDDLGAHSGVTLGEGPGTEKQHGADRDRVEEGANGTRVACATGPSGSGVASSPKIRVLARAPKPVVTP